MALLLERHEVEGLLDLPTAIDALEGAFRQQASGAAISHSPMMLRAPRGWFRVVAGGLMGSKLLGARLGAAAGFQGGTTFAALFDIDACNLLALMSYGWGSIRTAATVGLATRLLARPDAEVVGMLGAGRSAMDLLAGTTYVRSVKHVKVYSPNHREEFASRARSQLGLDVRACADPTDVVQGSHILLVATSSRQPVFDPAAMEPGLHVGSMGQPSELHPDVYRRASLIAISDKDQELRLASPGAIQPLRELKERDPAFWEGLPELGDVVGGRVGRRSPQDITLFRESGGGWGDLALAESVLERARERGLGREISL